uniref:EF-hand domain-containing protein n=1 Tax=Sphaeramia orbicularis TaxID=375764 RepID=A0A673CY29_9TELE
MDKHSVRQPEDVLVSLRKLKEVFDMCGPDSDGFIRPEDLLELGCGVIKLAKCLDPDSYGRINFKAFSSGVLTMKGGFSTTHILAQPHHTNNGLVIHYEEEWVCPVIMCTRAHPDPVPECQLFPGEVDEPEEEVADEGRERESDRDSAVESTQGSDTSEGLARVGDKEDALGELFFPGDKSVFSSLNEEQFEDYGEGEEPDYIPSSPCPDDETRTNGYSDLGSSVPSSAGQTPRKVRQHYTGELMDVYCSQCSKKVNLLNDLEARLKNLKASR